jgi:hypothetical protein
MEKTSDLLSFFSSESLIGGAPSSIPAKDSLFTVSVTWPFILSYHSLLTHFEKKKFLPSH